MATQQDRQQGAGTMQGQGNFTDQRIFTTPITAQWRGRMVNLLGIGNQEGHSPAYLAVDEQGQSQIASLDEVTVTDLKSIPPSLEQVQRLLNNQQNQQGYRR